MAGSRIFFEEAGSDIGFANDWMIETPRLPAPEIDRNDGLEAVIPEDWLKCWSALDDRARIVVDAKRTLLCADKRGRLVLRPGGALRLRDGRVEPVDGAELAAFEDLLFQPKSAADSLCLNGSHGRGPLILQAVKISEGRGKTIVGIAIRSIVGSFKPRWADLKRAFHLTQAEDEVVKGLLGGSSAEQIAETHGLSLDTIRTHIRHAYDKLHVSSRDQMWHRLAPYRLN